MATRKRTKEEEPEEAFEDEPIAKRVAAAVAEDVSMMDADSARPSSYEDLAHWNRMFFELMVRAKSHIREGVAERSLSS
jgi:hypothetical protein